MHPWLLAGTTFFASAVEFVEAATIVLAVAYTQGVRAALIGTFGATVALVAFVALGTPLLLNTAALAHIEVIVGPFLVLFGIAWLRKAIWRYAGRKAQHDEAAIFAREVAELRADRGHHRGIAVAFQGVFVEGLEVAVIVVTFAASTPHALAWTAGGALVALAAVVAAALAFRAPLARVPENALKSIVGVMLLSLGTYWTGEGAGLAWPLGDTTLFAFIAGFALIGALLVGVHRRAARA
ncbi:MAG: hypothetical protein KGN02_13565 [bacterium]|nr:hypothetical protein [bacterium]